MWLALAFLSAFLLGCYEVNKKMSLNGNAVIPVLFLNTLISSLIFLPFILLSYTTNRLDGTMFYVPKASFETHMAVLLKAVIVLTSWISGYFALKHLPLTITGPIKATQPVLTLVGALLIFGERLNLYQWIVPMDRCALRYRLLLPALLIRQEGRNQLRAQQMDLPDRHIHPDRSSEWPLRQVPDARARRDDRPGLVQHLPMRHHGGYPVVPLVSDPQTDDTVRMAVEHHFHFRLPLRGRLGLFLCPYLPRFDDLDRLDGTAKQCIGNLCGRSPLLP